MSRGEGSESVNGDHLRAFIERIERMQEERKSISDDIGEIYAEAKGTGFDTKVMRTIVRIRAQDHNERMEQEAILDLYMAALGMQAAPREDDDDEPPAPAPARASAVPVRSAPDGITPTVAENVTVHVTDEPGIEPVGGEPSVANEDAPAAHSATPGGPADGGGRITAPVPSATQSTAAGSDRLGTEGKVGVSPTPDRMLTEQEVAPLAGDQAEPGAVDATAVAAPPVDTTVMPFVAKPRRPLCKRPQMCGGYGPRHCGADGETCRAVAITAGGAEIEHHGPIG